jgi:prephenate dehydratase
MKKIALQGVRGCFHEIAARAYFRNEDLEIVECKSFKDVFEAMKKDSSLLGVIAIENTIAGSLLPNHDLLRNSNSWIIGEHKLRVKQNLCVLPEDELVDIREVRSHPIALMQCGDFLDTHPDWKLVETEDTALSAREIARTNGHGQAAICGTLAAEIYGLKVLAPGIETNKRNFTRFLMLADRWQAEDMNKDQEINKASLVFAVSHLPGALSKVLSIFSFYDINLTKIQSLPIVGREWEYLFYIDVTFDDFLRYKQSLDAIAPLTKNLKILGEYASGEQTV